VTLDLAIYFVSLPFLSFSLSDTFEIGG